jgi:hypothetical protein
MARLVAFHLESRDVGGTQLVTVSLGNYEIGRYFPGTRDAEYAISEVEKALAVALGNALSSVAVERGLVEDDSL